MSGHTPGDAPDWLAGLLAEHQIAAFLTDRGPFICSCKHESVKVDPRVIWRDERNVLHHAHVADVLWAEIDKRISDVLPSEWYERVMDDALKATS